MTEAAVASDVRACIHAKWANAAPAWGRNADEIDERAAPITERMLARARLRPGDRVLELASGPGGTGLAAAAAVGADGLVVISDVVPAMVDIAAARAGARATTNVRTAVLDLEDIEQRDGSFDVLLCREGMMFALDPAQAATEMHRVLVPGGRVAVAVWARPEENPWLGLVFAVITEMVGPVLPGPGQPGPFALADAERLVQLFDDAGFTAVEVERVDAPLKVASFDAWWSRNLTAAGPVVGILNGLDEPTRAEVQSRLHDASRRYETDAGLELPGVALVVTGERP